MRVTARTMSEFSKGGYPVISSNQTALQLFASERSVCVFSFGILTVVVVAQRL